MALDGIMFEGVTVRVRRPNDYNPAAAAELGPPCPPRPQPGRDRLAAGRHERGARPCPQPPLGCLIRPAFRFSFWWA